MLDRTKKLQGDLGSSYRAAFDGYLESVRERSGSWNQDVGEYQQINRPDQQTQINRPGLTPGQRHAIVPVIATVRSPFFYRIWR
jgi:hypothetical protein